MFYQSYKAKTRCVGVNIKKMHFYFSQIFPLFYITKHFTKGLHTQQRLKTN